MATEALTLDSECKGNTISLAGHAGLCLLEMSATNFLSYKNLQINFQSGLYLIDGFNYDENTANGAGKSAMIDAICYGLYGEIPRDIKLNDLRTRFIDGPCVVSIEFSVANITHKILRSRFPVKLEYVVNGEQIVAADAKTMQTKITQAIGLSMHTFLRSVYLPQDAPISDQFLFANDMAKKSILTEILGLEVFDRCLEDTKVAMKNIREKIIAGTVVVDRLQSEIIGRNRDLLAAREAANNFESRRQSDIKRLTDRIEQLKVGHNDSVTTAQNQIDALTSTLQDITQPSAESDVTNLEQQLSSAHQQRGLLLNQQQTINNEIASLRNKLKTWDTLSSTCHVCQQKVPELYRDEQRDAIRIAMDDINQKAIQVDTALSTNHVDISQRTQAIKTAKDAVAQHIAKVSDIQARVKSINERLQILDQNLTRDIADTEGDIVRLTAEKNEHLVMIESMTQKIAQLHDEETRERLTLDEAKNFEESLAFLSVAFGRSGIRAMVFNSAIAELGSYINEYLEMLFREDLKIDLSSSATDGSIKTVVSLNGHEVDLAAFSGGEKRRLSLATDFAVSKLINNRVSAIPNFICLDECFNGLDANGKSIIMEFLDQLKEQKTFIWVIDHTAETQTHDVFDGIYRIEKRDGISNFIGGSHASHGH